MSGRVAAVRNWVRGAALLCLALHFAAACAGAQTVHGGISGVVLDSTGAAIPAARVRATEQATNRTRATSTDALGEFMLSLLPAGAYLVEIEKPGFVKFVRAVFVHVNQEVRIEIALSISVAVDRIEVPESRPLLKTESAALSTVIQNRHVTLLPLDGRNFYELTLLVPGALPAAPGSAGSVRGDFAVHINGSREDANLFLLDGVYNGDPKLNGFGVNPPVDAILEFEVLGGNYDASFGRNAGGQVNVALKSGANTLHGTAYEFFRNAALDARNHFAPQSEPAPKYQRNQLGFSLGGPIRRDRTFFFGDYEGRIVREGITRISNVPTLAERRGDFSASLLPPPVDPLTGLPFPGGVIPAPRMDAIGAAIAVLYPAPNRNAPGQNFVASPAERDLEHHFDARLDHHLPGSAEFTARYSFSDRKLFEPYSGATFSAVPGYGTHVARRAQNLMLSETRAFTPNFLNEVRAAFSRVAIGVLQENAGRSVNASVGLPEISSRARDFGLSMIRVTGFSPLGDESNNPQHSVSNTFQVLDHVTYTRGRQLLRFGFDFRAVQQNAFRDVQSRGFLNFLGAFTFNPLADLLLGLPTLTGGARLDNPQHLRTESYAFFVHHSFRARQNLTLTAGLRYEYASPPVDTGDRANIYDPATRTLVRVGTNGIPRSGYRDDRNNLGPRMGLAWMPRGRGTVLRAAYGIYFDQWPLAPGEGLYFNAPYFDFRLYFPLPGLPLTLSNPFPNFFPVVLPSSALAYQRGLRTPYVQHWSAGVQQKLGGTRVLDVSYFGSKGTKLIAARDINQPAASAVVPNPRPVPQFDDINQVESRARSSFNSLQVRLQQNLGFGLSLLSSYTWSKSLDDGSNFFSSAGDANFPQDSNNLRAERARSNFDIRQRLSVAYTYDIPLGRRPGDMWCDPPSRMDRVVDWLLSGWQTAGIVTLQSGRPFTVALLSEVDNSNTGRSILGFGANDRPSLAGNPRVADPGESQWFNTSAFVTPPFGSFGNAGRNILEGPGLATFNVSLLKNVAANERLNLQLRTEFFNLFNRTNYDLPDNFVGSPTFGRILSAQNPRHIQLGLKLLF